MPSDSAHSIYASSNTPPTAWITDIIFHREFATAVGIEIFLRDIAHAQPPIMDFHRHRMN